jgi:ABC-2 type transport system ATP-binding protein
MNSNAATVHVDGLTKRFGDFVAVDGISFDIPAGEIWGFLGPNGAGKSTTIRMLCGVLEPSSGSARVLGYDVARDPEAVKLRIGYMSQGSSLWNDLSVEEHMQFYAGLFGLYRDAQRAAVEEWMERVGLTERRAQLAGALPIGFRKRLALACTLLHKPQMLFLDEPTSGVDPVSRREFWDLIVEFADEGTTVMVSTHYMDEAEHCNQLALIYGGRIVARGTPEELKHGKDVGVTVEIVSDQNAALLDAVDDLPYVRSSALVGSSLHVTVDRNEQLAQLHEFLRQHGAGEAAMPAITPSLEDVFAALVRTP